MKSHKTTVLALGSSLACALRPSFAPSGGLEGCAQLADQQEAKEYVRALIDSEKKALEVEREAALKEYRREQLAKHKKKCKRAAKRDVEQAKTDAFVAQATAAEAYTQLQLQQNMQQQQQHQEAYAQQMELQRAHIAMMQQYQMQMQQQQQLQLQQQQQQQMQQQMQQQQQQQMNFGVNNYGAVNQQAGGGFFMTPGGAMTQDPMAAMGVMPGVSATTPAMYTPQNNGSFYSSF